MCVGAGERCDGVPQCPDGSDETGCWTPTQECALRCDAATRCIPKSWVCDGHADCLDHTDEQGCGETLGLDGTSFWDCLLHRWMHQVSSGSRSRHCPGQPAEGMRTVPPAQPWPLPTVLKECGPAEFACRSGQCVALALHCDGDHDCQDGSDEEGCAVPRPLLCREGEVMCSRSGECVPEAWRCDGAADCGDGSDEQVSGAVGTHPVPTHAQEGW